MLWFQRYRPLIHFFCSSFRNRNRARQKNWKQNGGQREWESHSNRPQVTWAAGAKIKLKYVLYQVNHWGAHLETGYIYRQSLLLSCSSWEPINTTLKFVTVAKRDMFLMLTIVLNPQVLLNSLWTLFLLFKTMHLIFLFFSMKWIKSPLHIDPVATQRERDSRFPWNILQDKCSQLQGDLQTTIYKQQQQQYI